MSIVTLKKKSRSFQDHISGRGHDGFSLVGGHRNIGVVGPTNLAKSVTRTQFRGNAPMGHGGCCGTYKVSICNSGSCSTNDPAIIKSTVKNTKESILKKYKWIHSAYPRFWVKPDDSMPENYSQGIYIRNLTAKNSTCVLDKMDTGIKNCDSYVALDKYQEVQVPILEYIYPPSLLSSTLDTTTLTGQPYGNGTYNVSYSQQATFYPARNLFDGRGAWILDTQNNNGAWVQLELPRPIVLRSYQVNPSTFPIKFKLEGSIDGSIFFFVNETTWTNNPVSRTIPIGIPSINMFYKYYRLTNLQNGPYIKYNYPLIFYEEPDPLIEYPSSALTQYSLVPSNNLLSTRQRTSYVNDQFYGNGIYDARASSFLDVPLNEFIPLNAFDDDTSTGWRSLENRYPNSPTETITNNHGTVSGEYIQLSNPYKFKLQSFLISVQTEGAPGAPKQIKLFGTNDGTTMDWNLLYETNELQFDRILVVNSQSYYRIYRLIVMSVTSNTYTEITEIRLFEKKSNAIPDLEYPPLVIPGLTGTSDNIRTGTVVGKSYGNGKYTFKASTVGKGLLEYAFDDSGLRWSCGGSRYLSNGDPIENASPSNITNTTNGTLSGEYIEIEFPDLITINSYIVVPNDSSSARPEESTLLGTDVNTSSSRWNIINTVTHNFSDNPLLITIDNNITGYKYYRLIITKKPANATLITEIKELQFFATSSPYSFSFDYPPLALTSASTNINNDINRGYGYGTYEVTASSTDLGSFDAFQAFDDTELTWRTPSNKYANPTTSTQTNNGTVLGEYIQIKLPYEITLQSFLISATDSGTPNQIKLLGRNNTTNPWNILYETNSLQFDTQIVVNAPESYMFYRLVVMSVTSGTFTEIREIQLFENYSLPTSRTELVPIRERVQCKAASYHIGGKKIYRSFYSKDSNTRPVSSSQYIISGLYKKNNLLKPPCHNNSI